MIDVHVHLGVSQSTGKSTTADEILAAMSTYGIEVAMVMPQRSCCPFSVRELLPKPTKVSRQNRRDFLVFRWA